MTRCTEKTLQGKRCKKHASHNGRCLLHISDMSTETTVEISVPVISTDRKKYLEDFHKETLNALVCVLSRFTKDELNELVERASERKRILDLIESERA
jgi:hypothetical protein